MGKNYSEELSKLIDKEVLKNDLLSIVYINDNRTNGKFERVEIDLINLKMRVVNDESTTIYNISKINKYYLKSYIKKYNLPAWSNLPMGDLLALDMPNKTITLYYDNSKIGGTNLDKYVVNLYSRIPKDGLEYIDKLLEYIMSLKKEKKQIK